MYVPVYCKCKFSNETLDNSDFNPEIESMLARLYHVNNGALVLAITSFTTLCAAFPSRKGYAEGGGAAPSHTELVKGNETEIFLLPFIFVLSLE